MPWWQINISVPKVEAMHAGTSHGSAFISSMELFFTPSGKHMIGLHLRNNFDVSNYAFVLIT